MIRRILVGLGGSSCTSACIQAAVDLAMQHGAELTGVVGVNVRRLARVGCVSLAEETAAQELRRHRIELSNQRVDEVVEHFSHACRTSEIQWNVYRVERTTPLDCLVDQARYHDLVVLGLRGVFDYGVVGEGHDDGADQLLQLIDHGVPAVMAVGPGHRQIRDVLIACSGSLDSVNAIRQFLQLRPWHDVNVRLVAMERDSGCVEQLLIEAASYCRAHGIDPDTAPEPISTEKQLLDEAKTWEADLIVLGNRPRKLLPKRLFGDGMLHLMTSTDCPLFLA